MSHAERLAEIRQRRDRWMQERAAAQVREEAVHDVMLPSIAAASPAEPAQYSGSLATAPPMGAVPAVVMPPSAAAVAAGPALANPEEVLDKITQRLTTRLKEELRTEMIRENQEVGKRATEMSDHIERFITSETEAHSCPICYDIMVPPNNKPMLLVPCGHTFCETCVRTQTKVKKKCPYCRKPFASIAPNLNLQQVISTLLDRKQKFDSGELVRKAEGEIRQQVAADAASQIARERVPASVPAEHREDAARFMQQQRTYQIRCEILGNELEDTDNEVAAIDSKARAANLVLDHLRKDDAELAQKIKRLQEERAIVTQQISEQEQKVQKIGASRQELVAKRTLLQETLDPLQREIEKIATIVDSLGV